MRKRKQASFWGKFLFICLIVNFILLNFLTQNLIAANSNAQFTVVNIEASGQFVYKPHFFNNPPCLVLNFAPNVLHSTLNNVISVNRGMVKSVRCTYYGSSEWLKSISFVLFSDTNYKITEEANSISISIQNTPDLPAEYNLDDELIIKDYMPNGWDSARRREALKSAINFIKIKRQMFRAATDVTAAVNLTPGEMISAGTMALLNQPVTRSYPKLPTVVSHVPRKTTDIAPVSLGLVSVLLGVLVISRFNSNKTGSIALKPKKEPIVEKPQKSVNARKGIEELFLKEEELHKWSKDNMEPAVLAPAPDTVQLSREVFNFPSVPSDIAERRRFPRADVRNARGILSRALVGSKTQPFKNVRVNDISKGGLSFQVKSVETVFKAPTIVKLYFTNSPKPVDLWVRIVWERNDAGGDGKNVGAKFTRVPRETWDRIMESLGHRLG